VGAHLRMILRQSPRFPGVADRMGRNGCSVLRRTRKERNRVPVGTPPSAGLFSGPFAVRRLGRRCDAEGGVANRCLSEAIADVRASPRDDPSGPSDSRPRRKASPSAAARAARRRERSELVPVGADFSVPFLAGQKGDIPTGHTRRIAAAKQEFANVFYQFTWCKLSERIRIRTGGAQTNRCKIGPAPRTRPETPSTLSKLWPIASATTPIPIRGPATPPSHERRRAEGQPPAVRALPAGMVGNVLRPMPSPQRPTSNAQRPTPNAQRPNAQNPQPSTENPQPETAHPPGVPASAGVQVLLLRSTSGK
jgi:hypothetical protein